MAVAAVRAASSHRAQMRRASGDPPTPFAAPQGFPGGGLCSVTLGAAKGTSYSPPRQPNQSLKRTRTGRPLQAFISFWALRVLPARAAQLKR